ncbi:MAG: ABC transporter substrate-binding protein [Paludibacteraceae bacterium]|nr:ABC transporter substrate-binding protein [Paludibacteraceae bacterium]
MKKLLVSICALCMALGVFSADREHTLKIYNWADYIDMENVLNRFPDWYREQTGEEVQIVYQTFDINESMLTEIEVGHEDYDVICPSEYIIERMLRQDLLQPINKDFGTTPDYTTLVAPFAKDKFQQMAPAGSDIRVEDYTVGYMWGTTGWLYNPEFVKASDLASWGALLDPKFQGHIFMKDAFRDVYSVLVLYAFRDEVARGEVTRDELVKTLTPERIKRVEDILIGAKENIAGWEVDFGKEEMAKGKSWLNLSWSGDAQWAIDEASEVGVTLRYIVPEEGSNVWFDGWCIPKYAVNSKAASYFINFMCMPENAIYNMEEIGYVSVIASPEIQEWANDSTIEETSDLSYFFGPEATAIHANQVFYPDLSVINRCALMHDCGEQNKDILDMWSRVKGDNLGGWTIGIIIILVVAIVAVIVTQILKKRRQNALQNKHRKNHNK